MHTQQKITLLQRGSSPDSMLKAWREMNPLEAEIESVVLDDWPESGLMMRQLCRFLTSAFPHESGEPLLDVCMTAAVNHYERARLRGKPAPYCLLAFATQLLQHAASVLDYRVMAWGQVWYPQRGEPLLDWLAIRGNTLSTTYTPSTEPKPGWQQIGSWILDPRLNSLIEKAQGNIACSRP